jgi:hypothetical protein
MSVNRSVQAAQRRRAGPTNVPEPPRGPSTSINSAQMFASQARAGAGPSIPPGRLAAQQMSQSQQARMQQQQQQQQRQQQQQETQDSQAFSKMTIAQAITLITLRLGKVEQSVMEIEHREPGISFSGSSLDDSTVQSIMSRLESLERRPSTSPDVSLLKQQIESMKPVIAQYKTSSLSLTKENTDLKNEVNALKDEMAQLREMLDSLRMDMETSLTSIVNIPTHDDINMSENMEFHIEEEQEMYMQEGDEHIQEEGIEYHEEESENVEQHEPVEAVTSEIVGTDLKQMIEQELNSTTNALEAEVETESFATIRQKRNRRR